MSVSKLKILLGTGLFVISDEIKHIFRYLPQSVKMYNAVLALVAMIPDDRRSIVYFNKLVFFQTELQFKKYLTKKTPLYFTAFEVLKILVYF